MLKIQNEVFIKKSGDQELTLTKVKFVGLVDRHVEKENLNDFIAKKREMFLVQVSISILKIICITQSTCIYTAVYGLKPDIDCVEY